jgi:nucleotide-binding universal stress UspA family protein
MTAMSDVILIVLSRSDAAVSLLNAAACLPNLLDCARINVLAVREPSHVSPLAAEALINEADAIRDAGERDHERIATLKMAFDQWIAAPGKHAAIAHWIETEGSATVSIGERGSRADMIVAGAPVENDRFARQIFRAALFGTDRPVLMVPNGSTATFGRCVAIAWRDEKRAVRAVIPALRCLAGAEEVHVLVGMRDHGARPTIPRILLEHGIRANLHVLPIGSEPFGQTLLDKAHALSADLLVMGAYAHSPLRELLLGGVTRYMLTHADLPVLMRH